MAAAAAPTGEDGFLELRERLKQDIRNKRMKQKPQQQQNNSGLSLPLSASASTTATPTTCGKYNGSFFGPSLSSVAPRVIQECKDLLQNPSSGKAEKVRVPPSKPKAEAIKVARDYSFLLTDDIPTPMKSDSSLSKPAMEPEKQAQVVSKNEKVKTKANGLKNNLGPTQLPCKKQIVHRNVNGPAQPSGPKSFDRNPTKGKLIPKARPAEKLGRTATAEARPKKRRLEECDNVDPEEIIKFIREIYKYNPTKYGKDDCDDRNMEANFHEIEKEERRSAKLARKEDDEELKKLIEESKKEMMKKKKLNK